MRLQYLAGNPQPHGLSAKRRTLRTHHTAWPATADESGAAGHRVGFDVCLSNPILCAGTPGRGGGGRGGGGAPFIVHVCVRGNGFRPSGLVLSAQRTKANASTLAYLLVRP